MSTAPVELDCFVTIPFRAGLNRARVFAFTVTDHGTRIEARWLDDTGAEHVHAFARDEAWRLVTWAHRMATG